MLVLAATERELGPLLEALVERDPQERQDGAPSWPPHRHGTIDGTQVSLVTTGVGKVNAAAAGALAIERFRPRTVLQTGIGGAYAGTGLRLGDVALAASEVHLDTGVGHGEAWQGMESLGYALLPGPPPRYNRLDLDTALMRSLARVLDVPAVVFGTAEAVTADAATADALHRRHGVSVESMEGAAVAQVALAMGVAFFELRGVSNVVGDRDRGNWNVAEAIRASCARARAALALLR
ncbi:MAG: futalosine hydrolase [Trueperaceae bacterium]